MCFPADSFLKSSAQAFLFSLYTFQVKIFMDSGLSLSVEKPGTDSTTSSCSGMKMVRWRFALYPGKCLCFLRGLNMGWFLRLFKLLDHIYNMLSNVFCMIFFVMFKNLWTFWTGFNSLELE